MNLSSFNKNNRFIFQREKAICPLFQTDRHGNKFKTVEIGKNKQWREGVGGVHLLQVRRTL